LCTRAIAQRKLQKISTPRYTLYKLTTELPFNFCFWKCQCPFLSFFDLFFLEMSTKVSAPRYTLYKLTTEPFNFCFWKCQCRRICTVQTHYRAALSCLFLIFFLEMSTTVSAPGFTLCKLYRAAFFYFYFFGNVYQSQCPRTYTPNSLQSCFVFIFFYLLGNVYPKSVPQDIHYKNSLYRVAFLFYLCFFPRKCLPEVSAPDIHYTNSLQSCLIYIYIYIFKNF
jgi:hypothetical protein